MPRAGLDPASVTAAAAALADEVGFGGLSMGLLAERLGVRTPSLYKHVDNLADLVHRVAVLAAVELGDALRDATQGRAGSDALAAAAQAFRAYVLAHPGRYAAGNGAPSGGPDDPLTGRRGRRALSAVLRGYALPPDQEVHALRMLRSTLTGSRSSRSRAASASTPTWTVLRLARPAARRGAAGRRLARR